MITNEDGHATDCEKEKKRGFFWTLTFNGLEVLNVNNASVANFETATIVDSGQEIPNNTQNKTVVSLTTEFGDSLIVDEENMVLELEDDQSEPVLDADMESNQVGFLS